MKSKIKNKIIITDKVVIVETIEIPTEHQQIVLDRMTKAKINPERLLDWNEVSKNL
ncbi:hypothetical protein [Flavobacterium sp.]|uniref:hypothetical protein n=1 Tax=Flavobacterium sp. TaxID=239 RepID=UPI003C4669D1